MHKFTDEERMNWLQRSPNPNFARVQEEWIRGGHITIRAAFDELMAQDLKDES